MFLDILLGLFVLAVFGLIVAGAVWGTRVLLASTQGRVSAWGSVCRARKVVLIASLLGLGIVFMNRVPERDWVHLLWSAQLPMLALFLVSGLFLCGPTSEDVSSKESRLEVFLRLRPAAFMFLALAAFGLWPLALQLLFPEDQPMARDLGEPVRRLFELAAWGFGGALPEALTPSTAEELERGVGHLPREVTVPMGSLLIAAWLWIAFATLAFAGRLLRPRRLRFVFGLVAPLLLALAFATGIFAWLNEVWPFFDTRFFSPGSLNGAGIWESEPAVMQSFGPVLCTALLLGAGVLLWATGARGAPADRSSSGCSLPLGS